MSSLSIGLTGILVSQRMIELNGQNITNADTPGYHRQVGELIPSHSGTETGDGVQVKSITRVIDHLLENAIVRNTSSASGATESLTRMNQLQALLAPGDGSLHNALTHLFNTAEQLSAKPDDLTQRRVFLAAVNEVADRLNATNAQFELMRGELTSQARTLTDEANTLTSQIGSLNQQINSALASGQAANALQDQRDTAIGKLAELVDVRAVPQPFGVVNVFAGGTPVVLASSVTQLDAYLDSQNTLVIQSEGSQQSLEITGGRLGSILAMSNQVLPDVVGRFRDFARGLVATLNEIQATGIGLNGPLTSTSSTQPVANVSHPLTAAKLDQPPRAGDLYITVTHLATGQRTLGRLTIDPATQSLNDIASAISGVAHVQGVVDSQAGTLSIVAAPGFAFDFTGNLSSVPDTQAITGSATASVSGKYTGAKNDVLNFKVVGSGTIGTTPGLMLEVRNGAGVLLTSRDIGQNYEPGAPLDAIDGVQITLSTGTLNNGDTFGVNVAAQPDSAGILSALGVSPFLVNDDGELRVNPDLFAHPGNLALAKSSQPGDGTNLARFVALRDQAVLAGGQQSFQEYLENIIGDVGARTQDVQTRQSAYQSLGQQLEQQRQSVSGVDPNEELMKLVKYQQSYQLSAHFLGIVKQTMDDLLQIFTR